MASILTKLTKCALSLPLVKVACANRKFAQEQVIKLSFWAAPAAIAGGIFLLSLSAFTRHFRI